MKSLLTLWLSPYNPRNTLKVSFVLQLKMIRRLDVYRLQQAVRSLTNQLLREASGKSLPVFTGLLRPHGALASSNCFQRFSALVVSDSEKQSIVFQQPLPTLHARGTYSDYSFNINRYFGPLFNTKGRYAFVVVRLRPDHTAEAGNRVQSVLHAIDR